MKISIDIILGFFLLTFCTFGLLGVLYILDVTYKIVE